MKKLLFNQNRHKIFNLDHLVSISLIDNEFGNGILLKFSSEDYFLVTPGSSTELSKEYGKKSEDPTCRKIYENYCLGNFEENKKLYEYFEHMFTKSSLCQKTFG